MHRFLTKQFFIFLITGGVAATVNFGSRIFYNQWTDFSLAVILAYITGMITAFILAKLFVFTESEQPIHHSIGYFIVVNLAAALQTWLVTMGLAYYALPTLGITFYVKEISHATGVIFPVFASYIGHSRWSFK
ncbi:GtrA family protein [Pseudomonas sp. PB120]|uniref:GtrA family protein n=1 Tax=Pseudomonas sp. PB120 TaxID=2494700 RepID=UPI0012FDBD45|nr:GtrA family protein [Pseudomonas sp. PB120]MVV48169.1 GtrA family protein [Pseudomonas sp. PB120]